jgi:alpha-tubulin suppressor-like RCC1 family protein
VLIDTAFAIKSTGEVWTWGYNSSGQLGDNSTTNRSSPVAVAGGHSFNNIVMGYYFALARVNSTGLLYAWGRNAEGELGNNSTTPTSSPVLVAGNRSYSKIVVGRQHSLALDASNGYVYAWGDNSKGQLGNNSTTNRSSPILVAGNRSYSKIGAGDFFSFAIEADTGRIYSWGDGTYGTLADGATYTARSSPVIINDARSFCEVTGGFNHALALDASNGTVYAWGTNDYGQLGDNTNTTRLSPVAVAGGRSFDEISAGTNLSLALDKSTGFVYCWGNGGSGQLGDNTRTSKSSPVAVAGNISFKEAIVGWDHAFALDQSTGYVYAWGANDQGQLGTNEAAAVKHSSPVAIAGNISFSALSFLSPFSTTFSKVAGVSQASISKICGVPLSSISKIGGVTN